MPVILFVCTGNICRSPMAAAIFKEISMQLDPETDWDVDSAGTWAQNGSHASANAVSALGSMGMDLSKHLSRDVSDLNLNDYDLILTMEAGHKEALIAEHPELTDRIFLMSEIIGSSYDIADPIGRDLDEYKETAILLKNLIKRGYPQIKQMARNRAV